MPGKSVSYLHEGDRVAWCSILGTYAEYAVAPAERVVPIPAGITFEQAAAALLQGIAAHYLHTRPTLSCRGTVLITPVQAAPVLLLTQLAERRGARVLTTVSSGRTKLWYQAGAVIDFVHQVRFRGPSKTPSLKGVASLPCTIRSAKAQFDDPVLPEKPTELSYYMDPQAVMFLR